MIAFRSEFSPLSKEIPPLSLRQPSDSLGKMVFPDAAPELSPRGREIVRILLQQNWNDPADLEKRRPQTVRWKTWQYVFLIVWIVVWIVFVLCVLLR